MTRTPCPDFGQPPPPDLVGIMLALSAVLWCALCWGWVLL